MTRPVRFLPWISVGLLLFLAAFAYGCSRGVVQSVPLEVVPSFASLAPGATETFVARTQRVITSGVQWSASAGSITSAGLFTAPTAPGSYQIQATYAGATGSSTAMVSVPGTPASFYAAASSSCANMPLRSTGTVYYFCDCQTGSQAGCVAGDDANAGTSPSAPRQTWLAALSRFASMNAGDTVAFCKGGAWSNGTAYIARQNVNCTVGATAITDPANTGTCDMREYQASWGGTARPILRQTTGSNLIVLTPAQHGFRFLNLDFEGSGPGPGGGADVGLRAINWSNGATDFFICNNVFNGWYLPIHAYPYDPLPVPRMIIRGNTFTMNQLDAFLGGGDDTVIDANYFDNNGGDTIFHHTLYLQGKPASRLSVTNNVVRHSQRPCNAVDLSAHDQLDYVNFENNDIDGGNGTGCWAISVCKGDYAYNEHFRHVTIRRNLIKFAGWTAISVGEAPYAIIENNVIVNSSPLGAAPMIQVPTNQARTNPPDDVSTGVQVRSNTIYFTSTAASPRAIAVPGTNFPAGEGTGYVIANNAVYYAPPSTGTCFVTTMPAGAYAFIGNNACSGGTWGTIYDATTHVTAKPLFTNPTTNFTPAAGSPLIGAGSAAYAPATDFTVKTRPLRPSIGAYEP